MTRACRDCKWAKLPAGPARTIACRYGDKTGSWVESVNADEICIQWEPWTLPAKQIEAILWQELRGWYEQAKGGDAHATQGTEKA